LFHACAGSKRQAGLERQAIAVNTSEVIAKRFRDLDFHDDSFVNMSVLPAQTRGNLTGSIVELQLLNHSEQTKRMLRFFGCANLRVAIDFDVLADSFPPNTSRVDAHVDADLMKQLMASQMHEWDVGYGANARTPLDDKLNVLDQLICFRIQFFGGAVEVIAREFLVESIGR
jgi:hypothetical protein